MCASLWLRARGDRNHAHSSLRALYIVARSASEFQLAFVHVHCTELCRFCHRRSSLFSALLCSRLGSALVAAAPQSRLCSALLCSRARLGSHLCRASVSALLSSLLCSRSLPRLSLSLVAFDFNNFICFLLAIDFTFKFKCTSMTLFQSFSDFLSRLPIASGFARNPPELPSGSKSNIELNITGVSNLLRRPKYGLMINIFWTS